MHTLNPYPRWLMFNDAGGDNGGDGGKAGTDTGATGQQGQQTTDGKPATSGKTFTQEDVDSIVEKRLARERKALEGLDLDALKDKARKFDEAEAEKLPQLDRVTQERDAAVKRAEEAEAKLQAYEAAEQLRELVKSVADKEQVPADLLRGSDEAELKAHAQALKAAGLGIKKPAPRSSAIGRANPSTNTNTQQRDPALRGMGTLRAAYSD